MNLPQFLKEVDHLSEIMSKNELSVVLHDIARTLPEADREDFLGRLRRLSEKPIPSQAEAHEKEDIQQEYQSLKEQLEKIESWEMCLVGSLNEEYDDWYCDSNEEFLYEDPEGVLDVLERACDFVHMCIDHEEYKAGYDIAEILIDLQIMVGGEYQEYSDEPMSIDELKFYNIGDLNYERLVVDAVHAAYCANELSERPDAVYTMIENAGRTNVTMERVMQSGDELPEIDQFLKLWAAYLGTQTTSKAEKLLKEALELRNDPAQTLEQARSCYVLHPGLYEQYMLSGRDQEDDRTLYEVGKEALETIDPEYIVRSRIALLTSELALRLGMQQEAENCWLEAFRSDTTVVNYLRLVIECEEFSRVREETKHIYDSMRMKFEKAPHFYSPGGELEENRVERATLYMLVFLGGEFRAVKESAMQTEDSQGWSLTFMKCGLAAFLLLLLEEESLQSGCMEMCHRVVWETGFSKEKYQQGMLKKISADNEEWFWKCFCQWKKALVFSKEERDRYLPWVEELVLKRVNGIMEGNHRKYYDECAGYIAALGEVIESMGEPGGKQRVMMEYKALYSRRTAFHKELRAFGMKDK